jgi:tRNA dimethylallyltransferase
VESKQSFPVVFVLGTTAVGKSKLALDLAERLNGEIVNADSMQIYLGNGDGIMTANPSVDDLSRAAHHCYSFVDLHIRNFNV